MRSWIGIGIVGLCAALTLNGVAETPEPLRALARMPVKEVTVFKDGHAFVLHSGKMPTDESGNVVMDYLPTPVIGTFWPFSADGKAKLSAVTASPSKVLVDRTALTLRELIEANVGVQVVVTETGGTNGYAAAVLDIPARSGEEQEARNPPNSGEKLTERGSVVLLKTESGVKAVNLDRIQDLRFTGAYGKTLRREEFRNLLTLKLDWEKGQAQKEADVGLLYLQRGIRWIPNYKVAIDGKGKAVVKLQATLINELADLQDVTANLVIGVPTFEFKDTPDPLALQQTVAQLSQYFRQDAQTAYAFNNAIMAQGQPEPLYSRRGRPAEAAATMDLGPEVAESGRIEDLFVFTLKHVTLKKGQRMVMPVGEFTITYKDVFALDIPFVPPSEVWRNVDNGRRGELAKLFSAPKVMHKIRLFNSTAYPLTTAPALILKDDRILAQGLMTYASPGSDADLNITAAVDIRVKKSDNETQRTPNATVWQGDQYGRVDLAGTIALTSFRKDPVEVEVMRNVLGNVDSVDSGGKTEMVNIFEDATFAGENGAYPYWWGWFSWPWWWHHFNGVGRIAWTVQLEPQKTTELGYTWNYYWR
jgi:hypothetical protein